MPAELVEASNVDGAGLIWTVRSVILPICPITIALNALAGAQSPDCAASMAGALITSLPTLLVYIPLGRWFIGGLMAASVKS